MSLAKVEHNQKGRDKRSLLFLGNESKFLILSFILFVIATGYNIQAYSNLGSAIMVAFSASIFAYLISYGLSNKFHQLKIASSALMAASLTLFIIATYILASTQNTLANYLSIAEYLSVYLLILLLLFAVLQVYFYTRDWRIRTIVIVIAIALTALYFFHGFVQYHADDELILSYYNVKALFLGSNPYSLNFAQQLVNYSQGAGVTLNTNGSIISSMDYPALYFLAQIPFNFLISGPKQIVGFFMSSEGFVFALFFILSYMLIQAKIKNAKPNYLLYISLGLFTLNLPSMIVILMLAIVIMLYSDIGRRYEWLLLGIAASMQEQLWFMVLLFIAYSANTYGRERGLRNLIGAFLVFIIFNGYFIVVNPHIYLRNFFEVTSTPYPNSISTIGYLLATTSGVAINSFNYLFAISMAFVFLISLYVNNRKTIPLLSAMPFLFMGHALEMYFLLPLCAFAIVSNMSDKEPTANYLAKSLHKTGLLKAAYALLFIILAIAMTHVAMTSQQSYQKNLGLRAENMSISGQNLSNFSYHAHLLYNKDAISDLYLIVEANSNGSTSYYGVFNSSIISNSMKCGFPCSINVNLIRLNGSGSYNLTAMLPSNMTKPTYLSMILSNGQYYYQSQAIRYD